MFKALHLSVRFHDGRYHGTGDWPPAPSRLFQALVSAAGSGGSISTENQGALSWLEQQPPPTIAAPKGQSGQLVTLFVPNNELDAVGGDPKRIAEIRTSKLVKPQLFDADTPLLYSWQIPLDYHAEQRAQAVVHLADRLYQLGRGIDLAWAWGEILELTELETRLDGYPGIIYRPTGQGTGSTLNCPVPGSLQSLVVRYQAKRFAVAAEGKTVKQTFSNPPPPRFKAVSYNSPSSWLLFEIHSPTAPHTFHAWPLVKAAELVITFRDRAVARLMQALPSRVDDIESVLVGRERKEGDSAPRVRIIPLPSVGHHHADMGIRRILVEIPAGCPLHRDDVAWAFSGLAVDREGLLVRSANEMMLSHYGRNELASVWRTVTPAALPISRRNKESGRPERHMRASTAVWQALRHANIRTPPLTIGVQREPFHSHGQPASEFATGTRFTRDRLWHVEIAFQEPVEGPVLIGDGRFMGLGVMAPCR